MIRSAAVPVEKESRTVFPNPARRPAAEPSPSRTASTTPT